MPEALPSGVTNHGPQYPAGPPQGLTDAHRAEMIRLGIWSEQSVNPLNARPLNALPVKPPAPAAPVILGVVCRVAWRTDPEVCIGCRVPDVGVLPVVELLDSVQTSDWTLTRLSDEEVSKLPLEGIRIFPRAFTETVLALIPRTGPTAPLDESDPDFGAIVAAATEEITRQGVANPPKPGIFSQSDNAFDRLAEIAVRAYALPIDTALPLLQPFIPYGIGTMRERLEALQKDGIARPGYEAEVIKAAAARERRSAEAAERARRQNEAHLTVRRPRELLIIRRTARASTDKQELEALGLAPRDLEPLVGEAYRELHGLPGVIAEEIQRPGISILMGTVELTDSEYNTTVGVVSDKLLVEIYAQRVAANPTTYTEADFANADARTVEGRFALEVFRTKARQLIAAGNGGRPWAHYADAALFSLPVAFGGKVGLQQAADVIIDLLGGLNAGTGTVIAHGSGAMGYQLEASPRSLYAGRLDANTVPERLLAALGQPSPWSWGELLPTVAEVPTADAARIGRILNADLFKTAVTDACDGKDEVRVEGVYHSLFTSGAIDSETPNAEQKKRTSAILESLGYRAATRGGGKGKGPRYRCWVRELTEEDTAPLPPAVFDPLAAAPVAPFTRPIVDEANAAPYEPIVSHGQQGYPDGVVIPATPTPAAPVPLAKMGERPMTDPEGAKPYVAPVCHGQQYQGYPPKWVKVTDGGA